MTETHDIVVIGGCPSGMVMAITAKRLYPRKSVLMITEAPKGVVPCGIPYVFHQLGDVEKNAMSPKPFADKGGQVMIDHVETIDPENRELTTQSGKTVSYDKLVLATGSRPHAPSFLNARNFDEGIAFVPKSFDGIRSLKEQTDNAKDIIVLGSGFTAVELAEQLAQEDHKRVRLVYRAPHCLLRSFSSKLATKVDQALQSVGVELHPDTQITEIIGNDRRATGIRLDDGELLNADLVVLAMGYKPNSQLASGAGIHTDDHGAIVVDHYLRTSAENIFAVGDCAQTKSFLTGRVQRIMLASTAAAEARILAHNLYSMRIKRNFPGTLSVFSTEIAGTAFASAGVSQADAQSAGIEVVTGASQTVDRHPKTLSGVSRTGGKLIISAGDGQIIGGELFGGKAVGEMVNTLALAIQKNVNVFDLVSLQLGTHPLLTPAPTKPVLIGAAEDAIAKMTPSEATPIPVQA